ncbi:MAG: hypothetical protein WBA22_19785 [Candidatus Methanofastidiosia archaeon]
MKVILFKGQVPINYLSRILIDDNMETDAEQIKLLKKVAEDVEYIKRVLSESELGDFFLTKEEEKEIEETLKQREKGELLTMKEVFGE